MTINKKENMINIIYKSDVLVFSYIILLLTHEIPLINQ